MVETIAVGNLPFGVAIASARTPIRDGTISDETRGLTWEVKDDQGGTHDVDNTYAWAGTCSISTDLLCQPSQDALELCPVDDLGCALCPEAETCDVDGGQTVFSWVASLNEMEFAGFSDWRVPTISELESLVDLDRVGCGTTALCTDPIFDNDADSLTASAGYYSCSTFRDDPTRALDVFFPNGMRGTAEKTSTRPVRAVRDDGAAGAWWRFDGDYSDGSGNGLDGTTTGPSNAFDSGTFTQGPSSLATGDDYVTFGNELNLRAHEPLTISLWMRGTSAPGTLVAKQANWQPHTEPGWILINNGLDGIYWQMNAGTGLGQDELQINWFNLAINDGNWHHIALTKGGSPKALSVALYVDGVNVPQSNVDANTLVSDPYNDSDLTVGAQETGVHPFVGNLDSIKIEWRQWSEAEVLADFNSPHGTPTPTATDMAVSPSPTGTATPTPVPPSATPTATESPTPITPPTATSTPSATPTSTGAALRYAAMGDSYSSGEGARPYDADSNVSGGNQCHRSEKAYPRLRPFGGDEPELSFVACSGAVIPNVEVGGRARFEPESQIDQLTPSQFDIVTMTIGGNDLEFSDILKACRAYPRTDCPSAKLWAGRGDQGDQTVGEALNQNLRALPDQLSKLYNQIQDTIAPRDRTSVFVLGYPQILPVNALAFGLRCSLVGGAFVYSERLFFSQVAEAIDDAIRRAAQISGVHYVPVLDHF